MRIKSKNVIQPHLPHDLETHAVNEAGLAFPGGQQRRHPQPVQIGTSMFDMNGREHFSLEYAHRIHPQPALQQRDRFN